VQGTTPAAESATTQVAKRKYARRNIQKKIEKLVSRMRAISDYNTAKPYKKMFDCGGLSGENAIQRVSPTITQETGIEERLLKDLNSYPCADQTFKWLTMYQMQLNDKDSHAREWAAGDEFFSSKEE